jgi:hypothetical protein
MLIFFEECFYLVDPVYGNALLSNGDIISYGQLCMDLIMAHLPKMNWEQYCEIMT